MRNRALGGMRVSVKSPSVGRRKRAATRPDTIKSRLKAAAGGRKRAHSVLVVDVGGTSVKILATGQSESRSFLSGPKLTPKRMVARVLKLAADWTYDVVSIGYPGPVLSGQPSAEPVNLGRGWVAFDFAQAFGRPVNVMNDAAMQALGSYEGGKMLFLGLGTGLGSALIADGADYVGRAGLERNGKKKWRRHVADVVERLVAALRPDETVLGGGNVNNLETLPRRCRAGENANAFRGGFRMWARTDVLPSKSAARTGSLPRKNVRI